MSRPPRKIQEMPHYMFCARQKTNALHFQNHRYIGIFMPLRERERERASESESKSKSESERESKREEKEKVRAIIFLNRTYQNEKSTHYCTQYRKKRYNMYLTIPRDS
jgi:hypothetical protein